MDPAEVHALQLQQQQGVAAAAALLAADQAGPAFGMDWSLLDSSSDDEDAEEQKGLEDLQAADDLDEESQWLLLSLVALLPTLLKPIRDYIWRLVCMGGDLNLLGLISASQAALQAQAQAAMLV